MSDYEEFEDYAEKTKGNKEISSEPKKKGACSSRLIIGGIIAALLLIGGAIGAVVVITSGDIEKPNNSTETSNVIETTVVNIFNNSITIGVVIAARLIGGLCVTVVVNIL